MNLGPLGLAILSQRYAGGGYDTDAEILFAAMSTAPDATRKTLISDTIVALKGAGIWSKLLSLKLFASHDSADSLIDVRNPGSYTSSTGGSILFTTDRGWYSDGDGTGKLLFSGFTPSSEPAFSNSDCCLFGYWSELAVASTPFMGGRVGISDPQYITMQLQSSNRLRGVMYSNSLGLTTPGSVGTSGFFSVSKMDTNCVLYVNGVDMVSQSIPNTGSIPYNVLAIGYRNNVSNTTTAPARCSIIGFSTGLTSTENAALNTILRSYLTAVGAI